MDRFNQLDKLYLIKTYTSGLLYPWDQDKAPWTVEQGGDGQIPQFARENLKELSKIRLVNLIFAAWTIIECCCTSTPLHPVWKELMSDRDRGLKAVKAAISAQTKDAANLGEAEKYLVFADRLLKKVIDFVATNPENFPTDKTIRDKAKGISEKISRFRNEYCAGEKRRTENVDGRRERITKIPRRI